MLRIPPFNAHQLLHPAGQNHGPGRRAYPSPVAAAYRGPRPAGSCFSAMAAQAMAAAGEPCHPGAARNLARGYLAACTRRSAVLHERGWHDPTRRCRSAGLGRPALSGAAPASCDTPQEDESPSGAQDRFTEGERDQRRRLPAGDWCCGRRAASGGTALGGALPRVIDWRTSRARQVGNAAQYAATRGSAMAAALRRVGRHRAVPDPGIMFFRRRRAHVTVMREN